MECGRVWIGALEIFWIFYSGYYCFWKCLDLFNGDIRTTRKTFLPSEMTKTSGGFACRTPNLSLHLPFKILFLPNPSSFRADVMQRCFSTCHVWVCNQGKPKEGWKEGTNYPIIFNFKVSLVQIQVPFPANKRTISTSANAKRLKNANFQRRKKNKKICGSTSKANLGKSNVSWHPYLKLKLRKNAVSKIPEKNHNDFVMIEIMMIFFHRKIMKIIFHRINRSSWLTFITFTHQHVFKTKWLQILMFLSP